MKFLLLSGLLILQPLCTFAVTLENNECELVLDESLPIVHMIKHKTSDSIFEQHPGGRWAVQWRDGSSSRLEEMAATHVRQDDTVVYTFSDESHVLGIQVSLHGSVIKWQVQDPGHSLAGIRFHDEPVIQVAADDAWRLAVVWDMMDGGRLMDPFSGDGPASADWAVLYNGDAALTLHNNVVRDPLRIVQEDAACGLANQDWVYILKDGHTTPLLSWELAVVTDLNHDSTADWQDGSIHLRQYVRTMLPDLIHRGLLYWIGIESAAGNVMNATFPQTAEVIRRIYNVTGGEPVYAGLAGWSYWGWDSEYPAPYEASRRGGGNRALVDLCREAWRYSSRVALCINFDDAYKHSPAWEPDIMCTHPDGSPHKYMYWAGGMAYHICPYKDVQSGSAFSRIETMLNFGSSGSCYIDVLSAAGAMDKTSSGPGGNISAMDNLVAGKFQIADYYWTNDVYLYSEHTTYPFVGRILGGLNNRETGLDADRSDRIPMPAFILHGRMNNFFSATRYGRAGRLLLGIVPTLDGNVFTPTDTELDDLFLHALPARSYVGAGMLSFTHTNGLFITSFDDGTECVMTEDGSRYTLSRAGIPFADQDSMFLKRPEGGWWLYAAKTMPVTYSFTDEVPSSDLRIYALDKEGRYDEIKGLVQVSSNALTAWCPARVPLLIHTQDIAGTASPAFPRQQIQVQPVPHYQPKPEFRSRFVERIEQSVGSWVLKRTHQDTNLYKDKYLRPKDQVQLLGEADRVLDSIEVLGPAHAMVWDAARGQFVVAASPHNMDCIQMVKPTTGEVTSLIPLVPAMWGSDMKLQIHDDLLFVTSEQTRNLAVIRLDVPASATEQAALHRIFHKPVDRRDPEAALDELLRRQSRRLTAILPLGMTPIDLYLIDHGAPAVVVRDEQTQQVFEYTFSKADLPHIPAEEWGDHPPPFPRLKKALELPRERIVATNLPENGEPWWLRLPMAKNHIGSEPKPEEAVLLLNVGPRYPDIEQARSHAALIAALRVRNTIRSVTTGPLIAFGDAYGVNRKDLRHGYDYWEIGYRYAADTDLQTQIQELTDNEWYIETIEMPDGAVRYRAGLECRIPFDLLDSLMKRAFTAEAAWYQKAAQDTEDSKTAEQYREISAMFRSAAVELRFDWHS